MTHLSYLFRTHFDSLKLVTNYSLHLFAAYCKENLKANAKGRDAERGPIKCTNILFIHDFSQVSTPNHRKGLMEFSSVTKMIAP